MQCNKHQTLALALILLCQTFKTMPYRSALLHITTRPLIYIVNVIWIFIISAIPWSLVVYMVPGVVTGAQIAAALQGRFSKGTESTHPSWLYCTVLYCTVLYCTVLYCTVLYCTVLYCTVLYSTVLYFAVLYVLHSCYACTEWSNRDWRYFDLLGRCRCMSFSVYVGNTLPLKSQRL